MAKNLDTFELRRVLDLVLGKEQPSAFDRGRWQSRTLRRHRPTRRGIFAWVAAAAVVALALVGLSTLRGPQRAAPPSTRKVQSHKVQTPSRPQQASIAQLQQWNKERILYSVGWPQNAYSNEAPQQIFLLPKGFTIPTTLHHWPATRFQAIAVINDPGTQIGTGTGTLWHGMQSEIYWLQPATPQVLPPASANLGLSASPQTVETAQGALFAIQWPSPQYPNRTIFLQPVGFTMPTSITAWPPKGLQVVAVYPDSALRSHPQLLLSTRTLSVAFGVTIPKSAVRGR